VSIVSGIERKYGIFFSLFFRLVSSDHRRAVRPKTRQKASASHLKILGNRSDVSTDINNSEVEDDKLDPNTYSTYMGKEEIKNCAFV